MPYLVFDLDGTLLDSDAALAGAFVRLGVPADQVTFGHVVADECARLGLALDDYLAAYDTSEARPFPGVDEALAALSGYSVCSNKARVSGVAELAGLGWEPEVALFADDFGGGPKRLGPVLAALDMRGADVVFVGDTAHDARCAAAEGAAFAAAAWNPRAVDLAADVVLRHPRELLDLL
ncbi:MAG TPA: HAD-IA family hydrolase [Acidimicrobiales bacterium]|nr:HAD-IA family hydrolase [Acidimicrobiales bacterium]